MARGQSSNIWSSDGGGVASFSSLLIVQALMHQIASIIERTAAHDDSKSL